MICRILLLAGLMTASVFANLVVSVPGGSGNWYAGVAPNENNSDAFWDNRSDDGTGCNIGYWLRSTNWTTSPGPGCTSDTFVANTGGPGTDLAFLGGGNAATPVGWRFTSSNAQNAVLRLEVAGHSSSNVFGYGTYGPGNTRNDVVLFTGPDSANTTSLINVGAGTDFYFFLCPSGNCSNKFYSDTPYSSSDGTSGKLALFSENPASPGSGSNITKYWVGAEDIAGNQAARELWGDFNDVVITAEVVTITTNIVPEPGFYGALAIGLSAVYIAVRRRNTGQR